MKPENLEDAIDEEAENQFSIKWERNYPEDPKVRATYQQLLHTQEFGKFRAASIKHNKKVIIHNVLNNLQGLKGLIEKAGEE